MIDSIDREIINIIQDNARIANVDIARQLGKSPSVILERMRRLEQRGIIQGYEARINPKPLGLGLTTFILVRSDEPVGETEVGENLAKIPEVQEVHHVTGDYGYLLKVRVTDTDALAGLLKKFGALGRVSDTRTTLVLSTIKETLALKQTETAPENT